MIYCIGDSFTYGDELANPAISAWPILLGQRLNRAVTNLGKSGTGSTRIIKRSIDCVYNRDAELIVIAWPNFARLEFCDQHGIFDVWPGRNTSFVGINERKKLTEIITTNHTDKMNLWSYRSWLRNIILLQNFFQLNNQKYIMCQTVSYNTEFPASDNQDLISHIDTRHYLDWQKAGICNWCEGVPIGPNHHPLEQGHKIIANKIYEYIRNFSWFP
jgi:hypothetical protein